MDGKLEAVITSATSRLECILESKSPAQMECVIEKGFSARMEEREVIPSGEVQIITPSAGFDGMSKVTVGKIPQNYGLITYDGTRILVS
jgi:hypothetical protein